MDDIEDKVTNVTSRLIMLVDLAPGNPLAFRLPYYKPYAQGYKRIFGLVAPKLKKDGIRRHVYFPAYAPFAQYFHDDLERVFPGIPWTDAAKDALKAAGEDQQALTDPGEDSALARRCVLPPFAHQLEGVKRVVNNLRCALFFHPGLGKTKTVIDAMRELVAAGEALFTLILCPTANIVMNWSREFEKHTTIDERKRGVFELHNLCNSRGGSMTKAQRRKAYTRLSSRVEDASRTSSLVVVMSYGTYVNDVKDEGPLSPIVPRLNMSVLDESHYLMSPGSIRTKSIISTLKTRRRVLLSGTPNLGDPLHLYGQLKFLAPFLVTDNEFHFKRRYHVLEPAYICSVCHMLNKPAYSVDPITKKKSSTSPTRGCASCRSNKFKMTWLTLGYKNLISLAEITGLVSLRKKQEDCLDLPGRQFIDIPYHLDKGTRESYNALVTSLTTLIDDEEITLTNVTERILRMLQLLNGYISYKETTYPEGPDFPVYEAKHTIAKKQPRLDRLSDLLDSILADEANKVIIWDWFLISMDLIERVLTKKKVGYVRVDGSTRNRTELEDKFNNDPDCRVYLSQMATGIGVTLNAANYTIYAGWTYDLKPYTQSLERNYRIGQERKVTVYRLLVPGSLHEALRASLKVKEGLAEAVTNRMACVTCVHAAPCIEGGIQPFTAGCRICPDRVTRIKSKPALLD